VLPLQLNDARPTQGGALPRIGEHTVDILAALGISASDIAALEVARVIRHSYEEPI
jgi:crotonobetainyl-CoA:carnitine CoA-transferase CaiB-like acyl-CoA transferase